MIRPSGQRYALFGCVAVAIVNRRDAAHLAGLVIENGLDNMRRNAVPGHAAGDRAPAIMQDPRRPEIGRRVELFLRTRESQHAAENKLALAGWASMIANA